MAGSIAVLYAANGQLITAAFFVLIGILFDFLDGFIARLLKAQGPLGVQLDSLADMVTSGLVPGIVMFQLLTRSIHKDWTDGLSCEIGNWMSFEESGTLVYGANIHFLPFLGLLLTLGACYRLAKFNLDDRQTNDFIGLPTPAMALFVLSLPLIAAYSDITIAKELVGNKYFLLSVIFVLTMLMNVEIRLFSLKFKNFSFSNHWIELLFILISLVAIVLLQFVAVPIIIALYVLFSILKNSLKTS